MYVCKFKLVFAKELNVYFVKLILLNKIFVNIEGRY